MAKKEKDYQASKIEAQIELNKVFQDLHVKVAETFESGSREDIERVTLIIKGVAA